MTMVILCERIETFNIESSVGLIGGLIGVIAGIWALLDRYNNRNPKIKVFAPFQWTGNFNSETILFVFFRFSNLSQTPTYLFLETLKIEIYNDKLKKWLPIQSVSLESNKPQTDFPTALKIRYGIDKAKFLDVFDDSILKYGEPLCGYLQYKITESEFSKIRGEILDFRHKKIKFEVDFEKQKKHDPSI